MSVRYSLAQQLADGRFHSGEQLGQALGMSRAAIWKQMRGLAAMGLEVQAVRGKGYRLARPLELLEIEQISAAMEAPVRNRITQFELFHELPSTNDYLRQQAAAGAVAPRVCLAERQSAGRGRRGRNWVSPYGGNLYLSLLWRFEQGVSVMAGLSLVIGLALLRALQGLGVGPLALKWPNDVYGEDRKLAGILIDLAGESVGPCHAVIGVGVNLRMPDTAAQDIDQPWTDVARLGSADCSRNLLAARILEQMIMLIQEFERQGLRPFMEEWQRHDMGFGQPLRLTMGDAVFEGVGRGIDNDGALLLETPAGLRRYTAGEVSVRISE